jgi:hypothetical protein
MALNRNRKYYGVDDMTRTEYPTPANSEGDSSATSPTASAPNNADLAATKNYLEDLSVALMLAHNRVNEPAGQELMKAHMDPSFIMLDTSVHECPIPSTENLDNHLSNMEQFYTTHPSFEIKVENVTAQVDRDGTHAIVWLTEPGVSSQEEMSFNRESVSRMYFRRREKDGRWVWYKHTALRGSGDLF